MCHSAEARVEANLSHLVGARQEEVNHTICDHAAWEAYELVVEAAPLPEAVPKAWSPGVHAQQLPVGGGKARDLAHRAPNLRGVGEGKHLEQVCASSPGLAPISPDG